MSTETRSSNILARATLISGNTFKTWEEAEEWLLNNVTDERHECEVKSLGNHGQRVDFGDYWVQGEIVNFSAHWFDAPETEVEHERFVDENGKVIQLYYLVGETQYNAPEGYYYSEKAKGHIPYPDVAENDDEE